MTASTARANAMSVAVGMAQPASTSPDPPPRRPATARYTRAGTTTPQAAAATGSAALAGSRRSPATSSCLSSSPATKKKTASRPSAAQCPRVRSRCTAAGPTVRSRRPCRRRRRQGVFAQTIAATAAASSSAPPTVSVRRASVTRLRSRARWTRCEDAAGAGAHRRRARWELPRSAARQGSTTSARRPDFPAHRGQFIGPAPREPAESCAGAWTRESVRPRSPRRDGGRTRTGQSCAGVGGQPRLDQVHHRGVGERGDVADLAVLGDVAQQPAHDLAGAGLGQLGDDHDLPGLGDRADLLGDVVAQLLDERLASAVAGAAAQDDEGDDAPGRWSSSVAPTTAASATFGWDDQRRLDLGGGERWPETFMTSSTRPSSQRSPSSSFLAPSPAKYMPGEARPVRLHVPLVVAPDGAQHRRPRLGQDQVAAAAVRARTLPSSSTTSAAMPGSGRMRRAGLGRR